MGIEDEMKFKIRVCREDGKKTQSGEQDWWETYDKVITNAQAEAEQIIKYWNDTLRAHEHRRKLLEVVVLDSRMHTSEHVFEKQNSFTVRIRNSAYDVYRCTYCGVTAKRYGLNGSIIRDPKFKAKLYADCEKAKEKLERKK